MDKPIPKLIHISWVDKRILFTSQNPLAINGIQNMKQINPEYVIQVSDDNDVNDYIQSCISNDDWLLIRDRHIVEKTDLWRLLKIFNEGGVYCDIDRYCNQPFSTFIDPEDRCILPTHYDIDFSQDIMIASKGSPIHERAIELNLERRRNGCDDVLTLGPITYWHSITEFFLEKQLKRFLSGRDFVKLTTKVHQSKGYKVFYERPVVDMVKHETILYKFDGCLKIGNGEAKEGLYRESGIQHWTEAENVFGKKSFGD
tara:strand:+ start:536 stop:1306 length:771 start_codon:yes stop_codon:yes gene_type:complete